MAEVDFCSPSVIAVVGPTATGKTALGVKLAQWLGTEVISADSQVIYRALDLGTAKPSLAEQQGVPHRMIDVAEPDEIFSAGTYQQQASDHLKRLWAAGRTPVVVGGTGFYIRALLEADFMPDVPPNPAFRERMNVLAEQEGASGLHARLAALDARRAGDLHPNDRVRIIRALEIIETTGQPVPNLARPRDFSVYWCGLTVADRCLLDQRIASRIDAMLAAGWLDEVSQLVQRYGPMAHALGVAHGYPELIQVLQGQCSLAEAIAQIQINIRQYSRRQLTWFRRNPDIVWWDSDRLSPDEVATGVMADIERWNRLPGKNWNLK